MTEEVLQQNLALEIEKAKKAISQEPAKRDEAPKLTNAQINAMKRDELVAHLQVRDFPTTKSKVPQLKEHLKIFNQSIQQRKQNMVAQHGNKEFTRITASFDGSWLVRSYCKNARSPVGQGCLFGSQTRLPIAWGYRCKTCPICERAKTAGREAPAHHECPINHAGSISSMESQLGVDLCSKLLEKGAVVSQLAMDGDSTTLQLCQRRFIEESAFQVMGGEAIMDMKADDRHLNKVIKDKFWKVAEANTAKQTWD